MGDLLVPFLSETIIDKTRNSLKIEARELRRREWGKCLCRKKRNVLSIVVEVVCPKLFSICARAACLTYMEGGLNHGMR